MQSLHQRINALAPNFTAGQRELADFVVAHPLRVVSLPIGELAKQSGMSVASVSRFAVALGFASYADFRAALAQDLHQGQAAVGLQKKPTRGKISVTEQFAASLDESTANIAATRLALDPASCTAAVSAIQAASRIYVFASGQSAFLASLLSTELQAMSFDAPLVCDSGGGWLAAARLSRASKRDLGIAISFARYAKDTVMLARGAISHGLPLLALTDGPQSPLVGLAQTCLFARASPQHGKFHAITAQVALIEALLSALFAQRGANLSPWLKHTDMGYPWLFDAAADEPQTKARL